MQSVLKIENHKFLNRLDIYMKKRRFCNCCMRKILSIYSKVQERILQDDIFESSVGCDMCSKEKCSCKKCGSLVNGSIGEFANTLAQYQNKNMNKKCNKVKFDSEKFVQSKSVTPSNEEESENLDNSVNVHEEWFDKLD